MSEEKKIVYVGEGEGKVIIHFRTDEGMILHVVSLCKFVFIKMIACDVINKCVSLLWSDNVLK